MHNYPWCERLEDRTLFSVVDPITDDHPLWTIPRGAAVIDGVLDEAQWDSAFQTTRTLAYQEGVVITVSAMYDSQGIYLATDVLDKDLWADGNGGGEGELWQIETDDSVIFYFDLDSSREEYLQETDLAFGYNIGNFTDPKNTADGPVRRFKFIKGDGAGGAPSVGWFGDNWGEIEARGDNPEDYYKPDGVSYKTTYQGTLNDDSDIDTGWTSELFLPWSVLGITAPTHGFTFGMNFNVILDDTGGERDLFTRRHGSTRWDEYAIPDNYVSGVESSYSATQPGVRGPASYAETMFIDAAASEKPAAITDLAITNTTGYSTMLSFTSPAGTTAGLGHVSAYEIRYDDSPIITDRDWINATSFINRYTPRLAGKAESLRFIGLEPLTTYSVAIRAVDAAGNLGEMTAATFTTQSATQDTSGGLRLVPSPLGRSLMTEAGDPFLAVGDHLGLSWANTRQLFPGEVWDNANGIYQNFADKVPIEGIYTDYFDTLQARGVNTMRVFLEQQVTQAEGNPNLPDDPRGTYWIEHNAGQYNPEMRQFLDTLLAEADARGMYIVLSPFSTWYYRDAFGNEGPWATNFGGPLTDIDDFFQEPGTLTIAKARMAEVVRWVQESPYAARVMGYELINEWNTTGWTKNAEGDSSADRAIEMTRRAVWVGELARYTRTLDPQRLTVNAPVLEDPRGAIARSVFYSRDFDVLMPHFYTLGNEEAINNPDSDRAVRAAIEQARVTAAWINQTTDRRPILNGEWGPTRRLWPTGKPYYSDKTYTWGTPASSPSFTLAEDEDLFSSLLWSGLATGQFGTAMRIAADTLSFIVGTNDNGQTLTQGFLLTDNMRATQELIATWRDNSSIGFDFATYSPDPLNGQLAVTSASGFSLYAFGASDSSQGIVYIIQDRGVKTGTVPDGRVTITGLKADTRFDIEVWETAIGTTAPSRTLRNIFSPDGSLTINLPEFTQGTVLRFQAVPSSGQVEQVVALQAGTKTITFTRGLDAQPTATIFESATGEVLQVDISALANFRGRVVDMTPYRTPDGIVHLAVTDEDHNLWVFDGNLATGTWTVRNLTAAINAPGLTGDLTVYQPTWNAIHIGGLDARGNAVNYWWAPGLDDWQFADLTGALDGPTMAGGLASWVAPWGALNLAGLNENGEIIVYWWVPGGTWATLNMTTQFNGPTLRGQLSAFVTSWGAMNIIGLNDAGNANAYWWVPGGKWTISDLTSITNTASFAQGLTTATSTDGGINIFGLDANDELIMLRWTPSTGRWLDSNITAEAETSPVNFPVGAASAGNWMTVGARTQEANARLLLYTFDLITDRWSWQFGTNVGTM